MGAGAGIDPVERQIGVDFLAAGRAGRDDGELGLDLVPHLSGEEHGDGQQDGDHGHAELAGPVLPQQGLNRLAPAQSGSRSAWGAG